MIGRLHTSKPWRPATTSPSPCSPGTRISSNASANIPPYSGRPKTSHVTSHSPPSDLETALFSAPLSLACRDSEIVSLSILGREPPTGPTKTGRPLRPELALSTVEDLIELLRVWGLAKP